MSDLRKRWRAMTPLAVVMAMTLAACGTASGTGDTNGVASLEGDNATATTAAENPEAPTEPEDAFALFEECMADHGIDLGEGAVRTGDDGGGVMIRRGESEADASDPSEREGQGLDMDPEEFEAASAECDKHLANLDDGFDLTPEQEAAMEDARLEFQKCMKEHGIGGDFMIGIGGSSGSAGSSQVEDEPEADPQAGSEIDPEELEAANEECMKIFQDTPELEEFFEDAPERLGDFGGSRE